MAGRSEQEFKSRFNPDQELLHLRAQVGELEKKLATEKRAVGEARLQTLALTEAIAAAEPKPMVYKPTKSDGQPITCVLHLTDLHCGEVTKRDEVEGFGEFNPELFDSRLAALGERMLKFVKVQRSGYAIPTLHVLGTGDYISGDIHEELKVTNAFPAPMQAMRSGYALGALIEMLAPHFSDVKTDWLTTDNHGRMTRKPQAAEGGVNNWSYIVAHVVKQHCARLANVEVRIHAKPSTIATIGPEKYLLMHGHQLRGWMGLPYYSFDRRVALEAVKRMNVAQSDFTRMVIGHFHTPIFAPYWIVGGSLSGTTAYDHSCGRYSPPQQTSWLVHPQHGAFGYTSWNLSDI